MAGDTGEAGFASDPPEVTVSTNRRNCERCGGDLKPDVYHQCPSKATPPQSNDRE